MVKPDRPPDALLDVHDWNDIPEDEQNRRIDEFLEELRGKPGERPEQEPPVKGRTKTTRQR